MCWLDILIQAATSAVTAIFSSCTSYVLVYVAYPFKVSANIRALDMDTVELTRAQADVQNKIETARMQGLTQTNKVEGWLGRVEAVKGEVDEIKKRYEERSRCFGTQALNCWSNCWISKDATEKLVEVQRLREDGRFEEVATQLPPQVQQLPVGSETVVPQEEANLRDILRYIDCDQYNIIGILGMGGVGKTRLLHRVHNSYEGRSSDFDVVYKITASRECTVEKLQAELCEKYSFARKTSEESQANIISNYLINRNFLILLDDVWGQIDLHRVGIPLPLGLGNQLKQKVVITTRSSRVCGLMAVKKFLKVDVLDHEHALRLFKENVGDETINSHPLIPSLAEKVVEELGGLPLALITIGQSMSDKRYPVEWNHAIDRLAKFGLNEFDEEIKIFHKLKLSYDSLNTEKLKDCFLVCSLWPEDYYIKKIDLIECWLGLELLDSDISDARNIYNLGYDVIRKLVSACLLGEEESECVKMHDVIRDMALWIAHDEGKKKDKWVVINGSMDILNQMPFENIRWPHVERVSLNFWLSELPKDYRVYNQHIPCDAKGLQFLRVLEVPVMFWAVPLFQNLRFFRDLVFLDLQHCNLNDFPQGISNLVNLKYLNLLDNRITSVPEELKHVRNLRYLCLCQNPIDSFHKGVLSELKELLVLDLYDFRDDLNDIRNDGGGDYWTWLIKELDYLGNMRCLNITLWHPIYFRSLVELSNLPVRKLELAYENDFDTLEIPSSFIGNSKVQDNLYLLVLSVRSVGKIVIGSYNQSQLRNLEIVRFLEMDMLQMIDWPRNIAPEDLLPMLSVLDFGNCPRLKDVSWTLYLPCLRGLKLYTCENIVQLIENVGGSSGTTKPTFPSLVELSLEELPEMQIICDQSITFPSLEKLWIIECPNLKKLPFQSPGKLKIIRTERECWERLEWEDNDLKQELQPLGSFGYFRNKPSPRIEWRFMYGRKFSETKNYSSKHNY